MQYWKWVFSLVSELSLILSGRKEGNVLFNDTLNTFYLWLYGVGHMVKDHSDSERGNQPVLHDFCNKSRGMCYPVCGMVHIKTLAANRKE